MRTFFVKNSVISFFIILTWATVSNAEILVFSPKDGTYTTKTSVAAALTDTDTAGKDIVITTPGASVTARLSVTNGRTLDFKNGGYVTFSGSGLLTGLKISKPEYFGLNTIPGTTDMTTAIQSAFNAVTGSGGSVVFASTIYKITSINILNCSNVHVQSNGAILKGTTTGKFPHMLRIDQSSIEMTWEGGLTLDGMCNTGYTCAVFVGSGYNILSNFKFRRCALCWKIDRDYLAGNGTRGVSEISITGGNTWACLRIFEALGYNTIVHINGFITSTGLLTDANTSDLPGGVRPAAWDAADSTTIRVIGASLFFTGCHLTNVKNTKLIDNQPIVTAPNTAISYGRVYVSTSNIEANVLGGTSNPNAYATTTDNVVGISLDNCSGYIGGNQDWITLDANYYGKVRIKNSSFYSSAPRSAYIGVSNSTNAHWDIDEESFSTNISGVGYGSGLNALKGGIAHFNTKQILHVNTAATNTTDNGSVTPACTNRVDNGDSTRFIAAYNSTTGAFTVPKGGLRHVVFYFQFALAASSPSADVAVSLNGTQYAFGPTTSSPAKTATAYFPLLSEGDVIKPFIANRTGGRITCDGTTLNRIIITASNP